MPYIPSSRRDLVLMNGPETVGELTFLLTEHVRRYVADKGESFVRYAEVVAALECTKLEMYRRQVGEYENAAILRNGDVWPAE